MSYLNEYDDGIDAIENFDADTLGTGSYPLLNGIIWYFRISAALTALLALIGAFAVDEALLGFAVTLVAGMGAAGIQLVISEVVSVFVDTATNTRRAAVELEQVGRDIATVRARIDEVVDASA
jgi:hypothetical protein